MRVRSSDLAHRFFEMGHEITSTTIIYLLLIQVGQLSVAGEKDVDLVLVNCTREHAMRNTVVRSTDGSPYMSCIMKKPVFAVSD